MFICSGLAYASASCCHMCQNNSPPTCSLSAQRVPQLIRSDQAAGLGRGRWHQVASEAASEEGVGRLPGTEHHWGPNAQWRDGRVVYPGYVVTQNSEDYGNKCLRVFVCHLRPKEHLKFNSWVMFHFRVIVSVFFSTYRKEDRQVGGVWCHPSSDQRGDWGRGEGGALPRAVHVPSWGKGHQTCRGDTDCIC